MKPSPIPINTELCLQPPAPDQAREVFQLLELNREFLSLWLFGMPAIRTAEDARRFLFDAQRFNEGGQRCTFVIYFRGRVAGLIALVAINWQHHSAELGFWLSQHLQGQGIISKSCHALLHYAFEQLCLNRIFLQATAHNQRSLAVARRLRMAEEGRLRQALRLNNTYHDLHIFSILRKDWKKS